MRRNTRDLVARHLRHATIADGVVEFQVHELCMADVYHWPWVRTAESGNLHVLCDFAHQALKLSGTARVSTHRCIGS